MSLLLPFFSLLDSLSRKALDTSKEQTDTLSDTLYRRWGVVSRRRPRPKTKMKEEEDQMEETHRQITIVNESPTTRAGKWTDGFASISTEAIGKRCPRSTFSG